MAPTVNLQQGLPKGLKFVTITPKVVLKIVFNAITFVFICSLKTSLAASLKECELSQSMLQAALKCGKNCNFLKIVIEAPKEKQRTENVTLFKACLFS